ncbi:MAG: hypothetical protein KatS3mg031_2566 [Chitinophagales bacterium]|nr:MAG: hypothetical protein KatS3mg031_2566 [Chitinophagales bacterium]
MNSEYLSVFKGVRVALWILLPAAVAYFLASCANIVPPSGGPKDETPPKFIKSSPPNGTTRFSAKIITLEFDEFVQLVNPFQEIIISPAIEPAPKILTKGKKVIIDLRRTRLDSNTTYLIFFGQALRDFTESNPLQNFSYVFSTGPELDSASLTGKVFLAKEGLPAAKVLVLLHPPSDDSAVIKNRPYYFTRTNEAGEYAFSNIKEGYYMVYALKDENANFLYDLPNEFIGFSDSAIWVKHNTQPAYLFVFQHVTGTTPRLLSIDDSRLGRLILIYSEPIGDLKCLFLPHQEPAGIVEFNDTRDTVWVWYTHPKPADSLLLVVNDTLRELIKVKNAPYNLDSLRRQMDSLRISMTQKEAVISRQGPVELTFNLPLTHADLEKLLIEQDSPKLKIQPDSIFQSGLRNITLYFHRESNHRYTIIFPAGIFTDHLGRPNSKLTWQARVAENENTGSLRILITGSAQQHYVLQLSDRQGRTVGKPYVFVEKADVVYKNLPAGSYQVAIVYDTNQNGRWDTGDLLKRIQPEKTYRSPERIAIRPNWEVEAELTLPVLPP